MFILHNNWTQSQIIAALVTGGISVLLSIFTFITGKINQKKTGKTQRELEELKGEISNRNSENQAQRSYEFEAKKKLYQEYEPIKFRLLESCENAAYVINELCKRFIAKQYYAEGALPSGNYFNLSIMYNLMTPVVYYTIGRNKLNNIDLQLDTKSHLLYLLNKQLYISFISDAEVSRIAGLDYTPYVDNWKELRKISPSKYRRQGFAVGRLDNTIEKLKSFNYPDQLISFGEFEEKIKSEGDNGYSTPLGALKDLFLDFTPQTRPTLWRILIIQHALYDLILYSTQNKVESIRDLEERLLLFIGNNKVHFEIGANEAEKDIAGTTHEYFKRKAFSVLQNFFNLHRLK